MDDMKRLCAAGSVVRMLKLADVSDSFAGTKSADAAVARMADRFAGRPAPSDCGGQDACLPATSPAWQMPSNRLTPAR
jgi:hypothetical protein